MINNARDHGGQDDAAPTGGNRPPRQTRGAPDQDNQPAPPVDQTAAGAGSNSEPTMGAHPSPTTITDLADLHAQVEQLSAQLGAREVQLAEAQAQERNARQGMTLQAEEIEGLREVLRRVSGQTGKHTDAGAILRGRCPWLFEEEGR